MASTTIVLYESNPRVLSLIVVFCADTDVDSCRRMHFAVDKDASHNYYVSYMNTVSTLCLLIGIKS